MKKIAALLILILALACTFCSCEKKYTWDDALVDIDKLKDAEFVVYNEDTAEMLERGTEMLNSQLKGDKQDFTVELVHVTSLYENISTIVCFYEFATEQQAKQMYGYYMQMDTVQKFIRYGKIIIHTNSTLAEQLLDHNFVASPSHTEE